MWWVLEWMMEVTTFSQRYTLPETNIFAPEALGWEHEFPFGKAYFQGQAVSFMDGRYDYIWSELLIEVGWTSPLDGERFVEPPASFLVCSMRILSFAQDQLHDVGFVDIERDINRGYIYQVLQVVTSFGPIAVTSSGLSWRDLHLGNPSGSLWRSWQLMWCECILYNYKYNSQFLVVTLSICMMYVISAFKSNKYCK